MKKILILIIILFIIGIPNALAAKQYQLIERCYYSSDDGIRMELDISVYDELDTPEDELEYDASAELMTEYGDKNPGDWWYVENWDPKNKTCPNYLIYDYNNSFFNWSDKVYASDTPDSMGFDDEHILALETDKQGGVVESEKNCKLEEMRCIYGTSGSIVLEYRDGGFYADSSLITLNDTDYKNFIKEDNVYFCPPAVYIKTNVLGGNSTIYFNEPSDPNWVETMQMEALQENASYISCDEDNTATVGQTCAYYSEDSYGETVLNLTGYSDGSYNAIFVEKNLNATIDITGNQIQESCDNLSVLYTDCLDKRDGESCKISESNFEGAEKITNNPNIQTGDEIAESMSIIDGTQYRTLMCRIKSYLTSKGVDISRLPAIDDKGTKLSDLTDCNNVCASGACRGNEEYLLEQGLKNTLYYCNNVIYTSFNKYLNLGMESEIRDRMEECISFNYFYAEGVRNNIFADYRNDCKILSDELGDKLIDFLDIIKIAGPLLALGLGTLDFVRTVASGDADKEMKNSFKRFSTRLIAAALLFLVPLILAFLMDMFLGNQDGYNSDNPFCSIVDWGNQ